MATLQGTAIKNTGYLDKVYFNTSLSTEEVIAILDTLDLSKDYFVCLNNSSPQISVWIRKRESYYSIICQKTPYMDMPFNTDPQNVNEAGGIVKTGWKTSFDNEGFGNPFEFNAELSSTDSNGNATGSQNELLKNLISSTSFVEYPTLDEFLTGIANSIREVKGTTAKINALTFEDEIRKFKSGGSTGGSSGVIEVDELPTENIDENAIYKVNKATDIDVYIRYDDTFFHTLTLKQFFALSGVDTNITYYLVYSLPSNPNVSNLQTYDPVHIYIYNDVAYVYANVGAGNNWYPVVTLLNTLANGNLVDKGYVSGPNDVTEVNDFCVTYKKSTIGASRKDVLKYYEGDWNDYKSIFDKTIKSFSCSTIKYIPLHAFYDCKLLETVNLLGEVVETIEGYAFYNCMNLKTIYLSKSLKTIESQVFYNNDSLTDIYYTGSETEWKAINNKSSSDLEDVTIHYNYVPE